MKIQFDDGSFVEIKKSDSPDKLLVIVSAKDHMNPLKKITNAAEITKEQFKQLISDVQI